MTTREMWPPLNAELPTGLTATGDEDGRTWTITGTAVTAAYPSSPRATLAAAFLEAVGDGVQVYDHPAEVVAPPCIVVRPADPYNAPTHAGRFSSAWAFDVDVILARNKAGPSLDALERAREVLISALPAGWHWVEFGEIGNVEISGKQYLKGTLGVATVYTEGMT